MNWILVVFGLGLAMPAYANKEAGAAPMADTVSAGASFNDASGTKSEEEQKERDEFAVNAQYEMDALKARIAQLGKKTEELSGEAKVRLNKQVQRLEREQKVAQRKLAKLKAAAGESWKRLKVDISATIDHLKQSLQKAQGSSD